MRNLRQLLSPPAGVALWALVLFAAFTFAASCREMLGGHDKFIAAFNLRGGNSLWASIAMLEGLGALMILLPRTVVLGACLLIIAMMQVLTANIPSLHGVPQHPVVMLMISFFILAINLGLPEITPFKKHS